MVAQLTCSSDGPLDSYGMPRSHATDFSQPSVGLPGQTGDAEPLGDSVGSFTLGDSNGVDHFVVLEDFSDSDLSLQLAFGPVNFLGDIASVDLDFDEVGFPLSEIELAHLGAGEDSDDLAVLLYSVDVSLDGGLRFVVLLPSLLILGEGLLLGSRPVLIESPLEVIGDFLSPDGGQSSETSWGFNVTDETNNLHGWALDDGDWFDDVLLDDLLTLSLFVMSSDMGHAGLVSNEGSQVNWLLLVVLGERSYSSSVMSCSALGQEG